MAALVLHPKWRRKSNADEPRQTFCGNGEHFVQYPEEEIDSDDELADDEGSAGMDLRENDVFNGASGAYVNNHNMWMSEGEGDNYDEEEESDEDEGR